METRRVRNSVIAGAFILGSGIGVGVDRLFNSHQVASRESVAYPEGKFVTNYDNFLAPEELLGNSPVNVEHIAFLNSTNPEVDVAFRRSPDASSTDFVRIDPSAIKAQYGEVVFGDQIVDLVNHEGNDRDIFSYEGNQYEGSTWWKLTDRFGNPVKPNGQPLAEGENSYYCLTSYAPIDGDPQKIESNRVSQTWFKDPQVSYNETTMGKADIESFHFNNNALVVNTSKGNIAIFFADQAQQEVRRIVRALPEATPGKPIQKWELGQLLYKTDWRKMDNNGNLVDSHMPGQIIGVHGNQELGKLKFGFIYKQIPSVANVDEYIPSEQEMRALSQAVKGDIEPTEFQWVPTLVNNL